VQGESTFHIHQKWREQKDESLYGLGQMQLGSVISRDMTRSVAAQQNVVVPSCLVERYGIFWTTLPSPLRNLRPFEAIPRSTYMTQAASPEALRDAGGWSETPGKPRISLFIYVRIAPNDSLRPPAPGI